MSKNVKIVAIVATGVIAGAAVTTKIIKTIKAKKQEKNNTK